MVEFDAGGSEVGPTWDTDGEAERVAGFDVVFLQIRERGVGGAAGSNLVAGLLRSG